MKGTNAHVITIHNDSYDLNDDLEKTELNELLDSVDAIVIGPGPGSPTAPSDIGVIPYIFEKCPDKPLLGICLGFQVLCLVNGCSVAYLQNPIHGQVHSIEIVDDSSIFENFQNRIDCVRYHSIFVNDIASSQVIKPLAHYTDSDGNKILMAAQHIKNPHFGVQYHPESICSTFGLEMVKNFWDFVQPKSDNPKGKIFSDKHLVVSTPLISKFSQTYRFDYQYKTLEFSCGLSNLDICDIVKSADQEIMLLNSASAPGEWSIIGLPIENHSDVITHSTENPDFIQLSKWNSDQSSTVKCDDLFKYLSDYMSVRYFAPEIQNAELGSCPFVGGLFGYMSYEEGSFIDIKNLKKRTKSDIDDTKLCFIERFIAISPEKNVYLVSIKPHDDAFFKTTLNKFDSIQSPLKDTENFDLLSKEIKVTIPDKDKYFDTFHNCQKYLHSGDSYELCLTYNTMIHIPNKFDSWDIYKALVKKNPSPYSSYMNFHSSMLLSTSPERFISWTPKFCQMRPIKGTLKKNPDINYEKACKLLKVPKELGENLMIVDLIRDNLLFLLDKIEVTKLMSVEEYETIYQLVSVIEGHFTNQFKGIDVLKNSLPPGSMTGAPKKRSVEILQELEEQQRRGLYSGICGYWSINDNADWSVIIRSLFNYSDDLENIDGFDTYRCGAGGALTVLSTDQGEWDEMLVKLHSVLQLFE